MTTPDQTKRNDAIAKARPEQVRQLLRDLAMLEKQVLQARGQHEH